MKKSIPFFLILVSLFFYFGCDLTVPVKLPPHESKLVVNSFFHPQDPCVIHISRSTGILDGGSITTQFLTEPEVIIFEGGLEIARPVFSDTSVISKPWGALERVFSYYSPGFMPKENTLYQIMVSHPSYPSASTHTRLPKPPEISNLKWERDVLRGEQGEFISILRLTIKDPVIKNFYGIELTGKYINPANPQEFVIDNIVLNNTAIDPISTGGENVLFFDDKLINGKEEEKEILFGYENITLGSGETGIMTELYIKFRSSDEFYYKFQTDFRKHKESKDIGFAIFTGEPISVYSNVVGGYGIMGSYVEVRDTL